MTPSDIFFRQPSGATCGSWRGKARRQVGGTLVGFILGVLVGLAGALAVAVYVTKVPVPFVDRVVSRKAADDVAEAERNRNWNPNAGLNGTTGKPAAATNPTDPPATERPAAPIATPPALVSPPALEAPSGKKAGAVAGATPASTPATTPKGSSDPLADLVASKTQGKAVKTIEAAPQTPVAAGGGSAEPATYFIQVGAYKSPEDAQAQRAKLVLMGLDAKISEREQSGRTVYRVRLGPYERQADAERMKESLEPNGFEAALVRVQR